MKRGVLYVLVGIVLFAQAGQAANNVVEQVLDDYRETGVTSFDGAQGKALWMRDFPDPKQPGKVRNCSTCHGETLNEKGKHVRTGKVIEPMAPSVNPERLTDKKFIEKWFKRNCKWVVGRPCTPQEKGDILTFLRNK